MLKIPRLHLPLELSEYSAELDGEKLLIWVDPPRKMRQEYDDLILQIQRAEIERVSADLAPTPTKAAGFAGVLQSAKSLLGTREKRNERERGTDKRILQFYADLWSLPDMTPMTVDELAQVEEQNPAFLTWLISKTWEMIRANQQRLKKN